MKILIVVLGLLICPAAVNAQRSNRFDEAGIKDDASVATFLSQLQRAVAANDREAVAALTRFPVQDGPMGSGGTLLSREQFLQQYDRILDDHTKAVVAYENISDLSEEIDRVAVGDGQIWFGVAWTDDSGAQVLKITAFNLSRYARTGILTIAGAERMDNSFLRFQRAVEQNHRREVAELVQYPLVVYARKGVVKIRTRTSLLEHYNSVFTSSVKENLRDTRLSDLSAGEDSVGTKGGIIHFSIIFGKGTEDAMKRALKEPRNDARDRKVSERMKSADWTAKVISVVNYD